MDTEEETRSFSENIALDVKIWDTSEKETKMCSHDEADKLIPHGIQGLESMKSLPEPVTQPGNSVTSEILYSKQSSGKLDVPSNIALEETYEECGEQHDHLRLHKIQKSSGFTICTPKKQYEKENRSEIDDSSTYLSEETLEEKADKQNHERTHDVQKPLRQNSKSEKDIRDVNTRADAETTKYEDDTFEPNQTCARLVSPYLSKCAITSSSKTEDGTKARRLIETTKHLTLSKTRSNPCLGFSGTEQTSEWNEESNVNWQDEQATRDKASGCKRYPSCPDNFFSIKRCKSFQIVCGNGESQDRLGSDQSVSSLGVMYNISNAKRNNIAVRSSHIIKDIRLMDMQVKRKGFALAKQILFEKNLVIIIGESGDGRKWMAYMLMEQMMKNPRNVVPYILYDISDWDECINMNEDFVICLEDVFGKEILDVDMIRKWELRFACILLCAKNKKSVILTMRKTIYHQMTKIDLSLRTLTQNVVDLSSTEHQLSNDNMKLILTKYISTVNTSIWVKNNPIKVHSQNSQVKAEILESKGLDKLVNECIGVSSPMGFLKQAKDFVATESAFSKGTSFFSDPSHEGIREIQRMIGSNQLFDLQRIFTLLTVLIDLRGMDLDTMFQLLGPMTLGKVKKFEKKIGEMAKIPTPLLNLLLEVADKHGIRGSMMEYLELGVVSLDGSYIKKNRSGLYLFASPKVRAEVLIAFLRENPLIWIQHLKDDDFCKFVRLMPSFSGPTYEFDMSDILIRTIVLQRLTTICQSGSVKQVVGHAVLRKRAFADAFVQHVFGEGKIDNILLVKDHESDDGILETSVQYEFVGPKSDSSINLADKILMRLAINPREGTHKDIMSPWFQEILQKLFLQCCISNVLNTCDILLQKWGVFETPIWAKGIDFAIQNQSDSVLILLLGVSNLEKITYKEKDEALRLMLLQRSRNSDKADNVQRLLEGFIQMGANIDFHPPGQTPLLHEFISSENLDFFRLVLKYDININCRDSKGRCPIHLAVEEGKSEFVRELLSKNVDITSLGPDGLMAIHIASREGRADIVAQIIKYEGQMVHARDTYSRVPLHYAKTEIVACSLVQHGAEINAKDVNGNASLHYAALTGNVDLLRFCLGRGGDLYSENKDSRAPSVLACENGRDSALELILKSYVRSDDKKKEHLSICITMAARKGNYPVIEALLSAGAIAESVDAIAAEKGDTKLLDLLIKYKIPLGCSDAEGNTALHIAVEKENFPMVKKLCHHGTDIDAISRKEELPIHVALRLGQLEIFKFLYNLKKEPPSSLPSGDSTLHMASRLGRIDFVKYILQSNVDIVNRQNDVGKSSLHIAVENGHLNIVRDLVSAGSDIHMKDNNYKTPLDLARAKLGNTQNRKERKSYQNICDLLLADELDKLYVAEHA